MTGLVTEEQPLPIAKAMRRAKHRQPETAPRIFDFIIKTNTPLPIVQRGQSTHQAFAAQVTARSSLSPATARNNCVWRSLRSISTSLFLANPGLQSSGFSASACPEF
ncbi:MAG TPA: hypothetical protein VGI88_13410 [Verrucomicrobiae bacterium]